MQTDGDATDNAPPSPEDKNLLKVKINNRSDENRNRKIKSAYILYIHIYKIFCTASTIL